MLGTFSRNPGTSLPNGAILLAETVVREQDHRRNSIVLCVVPGAVSPFVTWHRCVANDFRYATGGTYVDEYCYIGHYHRTLDDATAEYAKRVEHQQERFVA